MDNQKVIKSAGVSGLELDASDMKQINAYTVKELSPNEIFAFRVVACDNQVDRDCEAFPLKTLKQLAVLFEGKPVIFNHDPVVENQKARVYRTKVEIDEGLSNTGEPPARLIACCYMLRNEANRELISNIEGGICKEVSVGCAVRQAVCSICGKNWRQEACPHQKGKVYGDKTCYSRLEGAEDAYEISFVPVPAQLAAGVVKGGNRNGPEKDPETEAVISSANQLLEKMEAYL